MRLEWGVGGVTLCFQELRKLQVPLANHVFVPCGRDSQADGVAAEELEFTFEHAQADFVGVLEVETPLADNRPPPDAGL